MSHPEFYIYTPKKAMEGITLNNSLTVKSVQHPVFNTSHPFVQIDVTNLPNQESSNTLFEELKAKSVLTTKNWI